MKNILILLFLLVCSIGHANTFYVRTDGGTPSQCNGTADAPVSSSPNCAWSHPFYALPPNIDGGDPANKPLIAGGDTLIIDAGQYAMGADWSGASAYSSCSHNWPWDCHMQPVPSGTTAQPTKILGSNFASCANPTTQLWGNERAGNVINLDHSNNVVVGCLEVTDHSNCIQNHSSPAVACNRDTYPYGPWSGTGLFAQNSSNVTLQDLYIHGMATQGVQAGALTNWNVQRVRIIANGFAGWNGDLGGAIGTSSDSGNMTFKNLEIAWSGCTENYPSTSIWGCWGQNESGYGDGLGEAKTSGSWSFLDSSFHDNTQDGLDLLYADGSGSVAVERVKAYGNAGNQIKVSGPALIENSIAIGNCAQWFPTTIPGSVMQASDNCRALGNAVVLAPTGSTQTVQYNSILSQGDIVILIAGGTGTNSVQIYNNLLYGLPDYPRQGQNQSDAVYWDTPPTGTQTLAIVGNYLYQTKENVNGSCFANNLCSNADPKITSAVVSDAWNPTPTLGSPLIDAATSVGNATPFDFNDNPRPAGAKNDVGAIEVQGSSQPPPSCTGLLVTPNNLAFTATGGTLAFNVVAPSTCTWSITPPPTWLTPAPLSGTGTVSATMKANPNTGAARDATIKATGLGVTSVFTATQPASSSPCNGLVANPTSLTYTGTALTQSISITAPAACNWQITSPSNWLRAGTVAESNGVVTVSFTSNAQVSRTTKLTVSGPGYTLSIPVTQTQ